MYFASVLVRRDQFVASLTAFMSLISCGCVREREGEEEIVAVCGVRDSVCACVLY